MYLDLSGHCQCDVLVLLQEQQDGFFWVIHFKTIDLFEREREREGEGVIQGRYIVISTVLLPSNWSAPV